MINPHDLPDGIETVPSPSLCIDKNIVRSNLERMLEMVNGDASRLRPHIKTHKCGDILALQRERGINQIKCATIAEAEIAAIAGVDDVLIAYPLIGPHVGRFFELMKTYPGTAFASLVDSAPGLRRFIEEAEHRETTATLFLDLDCGMHRTGIPAGDAALALVKTINEHPLLNWGGIHAYDGHIHQAEVAERKKDFDAAIAEVIRFIELLLANDIDVPLVVSGGSPTFAMHAEIAAQSNRPWQCSPGTPLLWDAGYGTNHPDLDFRPAAFLLTRVVSHPGNGQICVDLGTKAVSAENPIHNRVRFPAIENAKFLSQSEEHLVIAVDDPAQFPIGTAFLAIPYHVCPSVALYEEAYIIEDGKRSDEHWKISRGRRITI
ncbi:D-TA family PLP-dependent enzyme [Verrucomicrobiales bacterium BCK34]|nr:D-TA family PLP-dependent enzyme [Verrucomicrobiales bacterium BCK34]